MRLDPGSGVRAPNFLISHFESLRERADFIWDRANSGRRAQVMDRVLGRLWFVLAPLAEMLIYYFVVAHVFNAARFHDVPAFVGIVAGLAHFWLFSGIVSKTLTSIVGNRATMLQIKIEPLTFVAISALQDLQETKYFLIVLVLAMMAYGVAPPPEAAFYPLVLLLLLCAAWSVGLIAATAFVFFRDMQELFAIALRILLYASPVIYAVGFVPESYRSLYLLNPFATLFALLTATLLGFPAPPATHIFICVAFFVCLFILAHLFYESSRRRFTKVI